MDTVYVVFYSGYDNEVAEIFEDYDEAMRFIDESNRNAKGKLMDQPYSSIPEEFPFNAKGSIWRHE